MSWEPEKPGENFGNQKLLKRKLPVAVFVQKPTMGTSKICCERLKNLKKQYFHELKFFMGSNKMAKHLHAF